MTIPHEIRAIPQWVCWKWVERDGKRTKPPVDAKNGAFAKSTDPTTWATFEAASAAHSVSGIGFVVTDDDPYLGVDLDHCYIDGKLDPQAQAIVARLNSYTEITVSGEGVRVWVRAKLGRSGNKKHLQDGVAVEFYDHARFFTVTGNHLAGTPTEIYDRQAELDALHLELFPERPAAAGPFKGGNLTLDDRELIEKAKAAKNGGKFASLWYGDKAGHGDDDSSADLALLCHLAFWTGKDADRMDRLYRQSGLYREKWERTDYRLRSIKTAIERTGEVWEPEVIQGKGASLRVNLKSVPGTQKEFKQPDASQLAGLSDEHIAWFTRRQITRKTLEVFGVSGKLGAIGFPIHDLSGQVVSINWCSLDGQTWQEAGTIRLPFGLPTVPKGATSLVITSKETDALAAHEYGIKSVISLSGANDNHDWLDHLWDWLEQFEVIYLATDMDPAGDDQARKLAPRLGEWRCRRLRLPHRDYNECLMAGTSSEVINLAQTYAVDFQPEKLRDVEHFADRVIEIINNREGLIGKPTGFADLDDVLKGWRGGELTVWTGQNGSGKSTILGQVALNLAEQGERTCVASMELAAERYIRWLICQYLNASEPAEAASWEAMAAMQGKLWFVEHTGSIPLDVLLQHFEYAARRYGVRHFFVDSLVKLKLKGEKLDAQIRAVEGLCDFADKFNSHVHLVAHPRKGESDKDKPDKTAIKGAGEITDLADNVLSVHRNRTAKRGEPTTVLAVLKNREHGQEGIVPLTVNPLSKRVVGFNRKAVVGDYKRPPAPPDSAYETPVDFQTQVQDLSDLGF